MCEQYTSMAVGCSMQPYLSGEEPKPQGYLMRRDPINHGTIQQSFLDLSATIDWSGTLMMGIMTDVHFDAYANLTRLIVGNAFGSQRIGYQREILEWVIGLSSVTSWIIGGDRCLSVEDEKHFLNEQSLAMIDSVVYWVITAGLTREQDLSNSARCRNVVGYGQGVARRGLGNERVLFAVCYMGG
ncbi:hypothetical protein EDD18DRAFT_1107659 [Armillaria luteobubalina]|uniref:Uncharacterized protein n=1 Tax=Armillaria luteobubalina TaxID=153913 RepID=A0AA39Q1P6_9AGAR|nr:hypothetical protein EDD18DRAFT_1107659 [Armillaria luteobubalina]